MMNAPAVLFPNASAAPPAPADAVTLSWRVHRLRERPARLLLVVAALLSGFCFWRIRRDLT